MIGECFIQTLQLWISTSGGRDSHLAPVTRDSNSVDLVPSLTYQAPLQDIHRHPQMFMSTCYVPATTLGAMSVNTMFTNLAHILVNTTT
jgi:hypothetical protein